MIEASRFVGLAFVANKVTAAGAAKVDESEGEDEKVRKTSNDGDDF